MAAQLPIEIWAHIASFNARAAARLMFVVSGLADFLHKYKLIDAFMRRSTREIYRIHRGEIQIAQAIEGSPDRPWPLHGEVRGITVRRIGRYSLGKEVDRKDTCVLGTLTKEGLWLRDEQLVPVGKRLMLPESMVDVKLFGIETRMYDSPVSGPIRLTIRCGEFAYKEETATGAIEVRVSNTLEVIRHFRHFSLAFSRGICSLRCTYHKTIYVTSCSLSPDKQTIRIQGDRGTLFCKKTPTGARVLYRHNLVGSPIIPHVIHIKQEGSITTENYIFPDHITQYRYDDKLIGVSLIGPRMVYRYDNFASREMRYSKPYFRTIEEPNFYVSIRRQGKIVDTLAINGRIRGYAIVKGKRLGFIDGALVEDQPDDHGRERGAGQEFRP